MRQLVLLVLTLPLLAACGYLWLPRGETTTEADATITIDGRRLSGSSVWLTKTQTQNGFPDSGTNYRTSVLGDAIVFEIGPDEHLFMRPDTQVLDCARKESPEAEYLAQAVQQFRGPCTAAPRGAFTLVKNTGSDAPTFVTFLFGRDGKFFADMGNPATPEIEELISRDFQLLSLKMTKTAAPLGSGMAARFPWILELPRTDICHGRNAGEDSYCWSHGKTYAQYFTTDLPAPPAP